MLKNVGELLAEREANQTLAVIGRQFDGSLAGISLEQMAKIENIEEAFKSMVLFLEGYYDRTHSNDVGSLLGDMILLDDGTTADTAAWIDWLECVEKTKKNNAR